MSRIHGRLGGSRVGASTLNIPALDVTPAKANADDDDVTFTATVDDGDGHTTTAVGLYYGTTYIGALADQGGGVWTSDDTIAAGRYDVRVRRTTAEGIVFSKTVRLLSLDPLHVSISELMATIPDVDGGKLQLRQGTTVLAHVTLPATAFDEATGVYTARGDDGVTAVGVANPLTLTCIADGVIDNYRVLNSSNVLKWSGTVGETGSGADIELAEPEVFAGLLADVVAWTHDTNV